MFGREPRRASPEFTLIRVAPTSYLAEHENLRGIRCHYFICRSATTLAGSSATSVATCRAQALRAVRFSSS